jgi:hypothetical protein
MNTNKIKFIGTTEEKLDYLKNIISERQKIMKWLDSSAAQKSTREKMNKQAQLESFNSILEKIVGE